MSMNEHIQLLFDNAALLRSLGRLHNNELMKSSLEAVIKEAEMIKALMEEEEIKEAEMIIGLMEDPTPNPRSPRHE